MIYGSAEAALGQQFSVATRSGLIPYTIIGLYEDVSDLEREAFGIGDFIFPEASGIPTGVAIHPIQRGAILMARISNDTLEKAESRIRSILEPMYGDDLIISVWEGVPGGGAETIEAGRNSVRNFALAVNVLGFIILATSTIGIFSVMLVEVLNRTRDIGLRRALGTTKAGIRLFFIGQALYYSGTGSAVGTIIALVFYRPIGKFLTPLFDSAGFRSADVALTVPGAGPIAIAVVSAIVFGALFGFFPALSASNTPIVECIREDAA
jgi:ABC-type antimicrobial peptide transport system permease subunit